MLGFSSSFAQGVKDIYISDSGVYLNYDNKESLDGAKTASVELGHTHEIAKKIDLDFGLKQDIDSYRYTADYLVHQLPTNKEYYVELTYRF